MRVKNKQDYAEKCRRRQRKQKPPRQKRRWTHRPSRPPKKLNGNEFHRPYRPKIDLLGMFF